MLTYDEIEALKNQFRVVVLKDTKWTYELDPAVGRIVSVADDAWRAHWDSGQPDTPAVRITVWTGKETVSVMLGVGYRKSDTLEHTDGGRYVEGRWVYDTTTFLVYTAPAINVTGEDLARIKASEDLAPWIKAVRFQATEAIKIMVGAKVAVVKGRKVPLGTYEVTKHAEGGYGPYVNLRDDAGKAYNYVAVGNVKVIPDFEATFFPKGKEGFKVESEHERAFLRKLFENGFECKTTWLVFADWLEENGKKYRAEALRHRVETNMHNLLPDTYEAEYSNAKRRKRYGW